MLKCAPEPFAHPNGIPVAARRLRLARLPGATHEEAKGLLQMKYFKMEKPDMSIPLFAFVGRITLQKVCVCVFARVTLLVGGPVLPPVGAVLGSVCCVDRLDRALALT